METQGKKRVYCGSAQELSKKAKYLDHVGSSLHHLLQVKPFLHTGDARQNKRQKSSQVHRPYILLFRVS